MADILNEITDGLNELIKETDEKYDKFLFEGSSDDLLKTFFSLIKYNGGEFKSDKQKNYLRRNGDYFYLTKRSYYGDNQGATAEVAYEVFLDDIGVVKVIKWSKNKTKQEVFWQRTPDSMRKSQEARINNDFHKALSDDMHTREEEHRSVLDSIVQKVREAQGTEGTPATFTKESLESQIRQFTIRDSNSVDTGVDMAKFNDYYQQIKDYVKDKPIIGYMLVLFDELNEYFKKYPTGFQRWNSKFYNGIDIRPEFQSLEAKKAYLDSLKPQEPIQEDGNQPRILQVIDAYEKAAQEADDAAFSGEQNDDSSGWNGTFANAMSPRAGIQYQEYMKKQLQTNDRNTNASELQEKAQELANEIRKEYEWVVKSTRGKGMKRYAGLSDMIDYFKKKHQQEQQPLNEQTYKVYHGTNQQFSKFDFKRATQGIVWFTDSPESIQKGEHGGAGNKIIMTRYITINKPAGWAEYEKYGLQQLEDMGYDGVILPQEGKTDYFVFSPKSISAKGPKELNEVGEANTEAYPFTRDDYNKEYIYKFTTEDSDNYIVNVMGMRDSWIVDYRLATIDSTFLDVVNKGRVYKIMATLYKIMQDFVKTVDPDVIRFEPTKNNNGDDRRYKLYNAFIKKNIPYNYNMKYKEPYGFTLTKKQSLSKDTMNEDSMADTQRKYAEAKAEFSSLDAKQLKVKVKEYEAEYQQAKKSWDYDRADEAYVKYYVAGELLKEKSENNYNDLLKKLISKPFMDSTIDNITMPDMSEDGRQDTFYIVLADESDFEYRTGKYPEFKYYNQNTGWRTQDLRNPHINPADALLTNKDLELLTVIVKLNNTQYKRKPLPTNVVTKDGTTTYEPPTVQTQDLQWIVGQGDPNDKRKQISEVDLRNDTKKDSFSGGHMFLYITVGDHPLISDRYTYIVSFDPYFKPERESLKVRFGISRDEHEVKGFDYDLYDPFVKVIKQVNPQSKLVNKLSRYSKI